MTVARPKYTLFHKPDRGILTDIKMWWNINGDDYEFVDLAQLLPQ